MTIIQARRMYKVNGEVPEYRKGSAYAVHFRMPEIKGKAFSTGHSNGPKNRDTILAWMANNDIEGWFTNSNVFFKTEEEAIMCFLAFS